MVFVKFAATKPFYLAAAMLLLVTTARLIECYVYPHTASNTPIVHLFVVFIRTFITTLPLYCICYAMNDRRNAAQTKGQ